MAAPAVTLSLVPAHADVPKGTKVVSQGGVGTRHDSLTVVAGSTKRLVVVTQQIATDGSPFSSPQLQVRSVSGKYDDLGQSLPGDSSYRTVGHVVVATVLGTDDKPTNLADAWDLQTGAHHRITLPTGDYALGAGPQGVVYVDGDSLHERGLDGSDVDLGTPFASPPVSVAVDSTDLVVTDGTGDVAVMSLASPGTYTPLDSGTTYPVTCLAVDEDGAACDASDGGGGSNVMFIPLDGSTPNVTGACDLFGLALSSSTLLWTDDACSDDFDLDSMSAAGAIATTPIASSDIVAGYGMAIVSDGSSPVLGATSADTLHSLFSPPRSPATASVFSLTPSRVVYVSDHYDSHKPKQLRLVRSVQFHATADHVTIGAQRDVGGRLGANQVLTSNRDYGIDQVIGATAGTTVYTVGNGAEDDNPNNDLRVATSHGTTTLHPSFDAQILGVSADDIVYTHGYRVLEVHDLKTGKTHQFFRGRSDRLYATALSGHYLDYSFGNGQIHRLNLDTGKTSLVWKSPTAINSISLVAHGPWVGWDISPRSRHLARINGMRNVQSGSPAVTLRHNVDGINAHGVLMVDESTGVSEGPTSTWFRPFHGHERPLLSTRRYQELPQLDGNALAWVNSNGKLEVAPYKY